MKKDEKRKRNKREAFRRSAPRVLCASAALILVASLIAVPCFALSSGSSDKNTPYSPIFEPVIEQRYYTTVDNDIVMTRYLNDLVMPVYNDTINGSTYITPSAGGVPKPSKVVSYTANFTNDPYIDYGFNISASDEVWGRVNYDDVVGSATPYLSVFLGDTVGYDPSEYQYIVSPKIIAYGSNEDNSVDVTNLYLRGYLSYDYVGSDGIEKSISHTISAPLVLESDLGGNRGRYRADINVLQEMTPFNNPNGYHNVAIGLFPLLVQSDGTAIDYGDLEEIGFRSGGLSIRSSLIEGTYRAFVDTPDTFPTYIDNDFNPIDWVVNVADSFLSLPIFYSGAIPFTLGTLISALIMVVIVIAILKLYLGG